MTPRPGPAPATASLPAVVPVLVLLLVLAVAPPPAAGDVVSRGRALAFESVEVLDGRTDATLTDGHARGLREEADTDDDGDVNHTEGRAFEERFRATLEQARADRTRLDGSPPQTVEVLRLVLDGLVGLTSSNASIEASVLVRMRFSGTAADDEVVLDRSVEPADAGPWAVRAPPGYRVDRVEGLDEVVRHDEERVVEGRSDGEAPLRVVLARTGGGPGDGLVPGPGAAGALAALAAGGLVLAVRRGRRRQGGSSRRRR